MPVIRDKIIIIIIIIINVIIIIITLNFKIITSYILVYNQGGS